MGQITKEKVQGWIKSSVKSMLAEEDGAVYFYDIMGGNIAYACMDRRCDRI